MAKTKLYMGWTATGTRRDEHGFVFRKLQAKYGDKIEFVWPDRSVTRIWHDFARNSVVEEFLASDADILWFLDSDVVPPTNILDLITEHGDKWELAGAPYPVLMSCPGFKTQQIVYTVYHKRFEDKDLLDPAPIPDSGIGFVDGIATGCLFIKRTVLEAMTRPFFEHKFNPETRELVEGEDIGFCKKMVAEKKQFFIDFSMRCNHFKQVDLLSVSDTIEEQKRNAIESYSKILRNQATLRKLNKLREESQTQSSRLILPK